MSKLIEFARKGAVLKRQKRGCLRHVYELCTGRVCLYIDVSSISFAMVTMHSFVMELLLQGILL